MVDTEKQLWEKAAQTMFAYEALDLLVKDVETLFLNGPSVNVADTVLSKLSPIRDQLFDLQENFRSVLDRHFDSPQTQVKGALTSEKNQDSFRENTVDDVTSDDTFQNEIDQLGEATLYADSISEMLETAQKLDFASEEWKNATLPPGVWSDADRDLMSELLSQASRVTRRYAKPLVNAVIERYPKLEGRLSATQAGAVESRSRPRDVHDSPTRTAQAATFDPPGSTPTQPSTGNTGRKGPGHQRIN